MPLPLSYQDVAAEPKALCILDKCSTIEGVCPDLGYQIHSIPRTVTMATVSIY